MPRASLGFTELKNLRDELAQTARDEQERARAAAELAAHLQAEASLFQAAVVDVTPIKPVNRALPRIQKPNPLARQSQLDERAALEQSLSDDFDAETLLETDENLSWRRDGIGADIVRKLRRGHWVLQGQIDLHGARRHEAREQLSAFLKHCMRRHWRCVRVVHGKGHGSAGGLPVLKGKVRGWLIQKEEVLAFCQAQARDGGAGALIVLLRPPLPAT